MIWRSSWRSIGPRGIFALHIRDLLDGASYDPETVQILCTAYDTAKKELHDRGQPDIVQEIIAQRILDLAEKGERDPDRLCDAALGAIKR